MLKYGIVGAANGAFISDVHIRGIEATHKAQLVAGCFSRNAEKNRAAAVYRGVSEERMYATPEEMAAKEAQREDRIDFVVITTPNSSHYPIAKAFLEAGFHVASDKPVTIDARQAEDLKAIAAAKGLKFLVTFTYSGYPALRQMRELIHRGDIGEITMLSGEYIDDSLTGEMEKMPWRTDPAMVGKMNSLADVGSHVEFSFEYLTGLKVKEVNCQLGYYGGFRTDSNACVLQTYENGATGTVWTSKMAWGNDNGIHLRIYGTKGAVEWRNEEPEIFYLTLNGYPTMRIAKGRTYDKELPYSSKGRLPMGHLEGLYYYFANIYEEFLLDLMGEAHGYYPGIEEGTGIMHWLDACYESHVAHTWVPMQK